jgi:hypothetical protein
LESSNRNINNNTILSFQIERRKKMDYIIEDHGFLGLALESEIEWGNLKEEIIRDEFNAVRHEDAAGIKSAAAKYFQMAIAFFKNLLQKIAALVKNLITQAQSMTVNGMKYIESHKQQIAAYKGGKVASVFKWKKFNVSALAQNFRAEQLGSTMVSLVNEAARTGNEITVEEISTRLRFGSFAEIDKNILSQSRDAERTSEKIDAQVVNVATRNLSEGKNALAKVDVLGKGARALIQQAEKQATEGLSAVNAGKEDEQKKKSAAVKTAKNASTFLTKILNIMYKVISEVLSDSLRMIRAAIGKGSAPANGSNVPARVESTEINSETPVLSEDTQEEENEMSVNENEEIVLEEGVEEIDLESFVVVEDVEEIVLEEGVEEIDLESFSINEDAEAEFQSLLEEINAELKLEFGEEALQESSEEAETESVEFDLTLEDIENEEAISESVEYLFDEDEIK